MTAGDRSWLVVYRAIQVVAAFDIGAGVAAGDGRAVAANVLGAVCAQIGVRLLRSTGQRR